MSIEKSKTILERRIRDTEANLKIDIDAVSEFQKLKVIFNTLYLDPQAQLLRSPGGRGFHIRTHLPSSLQLRSALGDCGGRIKVSELRGGDILFRSKKRFSFIKVKDGQLVRHLIKQGREQPIQLVDIVSRPFFSLYSPKTKLALRRNRKMKGDEDQWSGTAA